MMMKWDYFNFKDGFCACLYVCIEIDNTYRMEPINSTKQYVFFPVKYIK